MGDAERFVQIKMADVSADDPGTGQTNLRVHIRSIHVNLSPCLVNHIYNLHDLLLEHAERRGIRDHERRHVLPMLLHLRREILQIDVPRVIVVHDDDLHPRHGSARGIRPMRALGNEAHVPMSLPLILEVILDGEQSRVLSRGAAVGLRRDGRESRDLGEVLIEILDHLVISPHLIVGREGVDVAEARPRHGDHLRGRVELHRARSERYHGVVQCQVAIFERFEVAQHLRLGVMLAEDGMGEDVGLAGHGGVHLREARVGGHVRVGDAERSREQGRYVVARDALSHGDSHGRVVDHAHVRAHGDGPRLNPPARHAPRRHVHGEGIEEGSLRDVESRAGQLAMRHPREGVDASRNRPQPLRTVIYRVARRHVRQQRLGRAYVARGLIPTNVLFPRLHRHP
mmetsp:Transcript_33850/g.81840  ORF Transcript_33850/g.81840 Transcript_33850/m.81840 type:complete len:399 (+) Transcript_33850:905-2101(+)